MRVSTDPVLAAVPRGLEDAAGGCEPLGGGSLPRTGNAKGFFFCSTKPCIIRFRTLSLVPNIKQTV